MAKERQKEQEKAKDTEPEREDKIHQKAKALDKEEDVVDEIDEASSCKEKETQVAKVEGKTVTKGKKSKDAIEEIELITKQDATPAASAGGAGVNIIRKWDNAKADLKIINDFMVEPEELSD